MSVFCAKKRMARTCGGARCLGIIEGRASSSSAGGTAHGPHR